MSNGNNVTQLFENIVLFQPKLEEIKGGKNKIEKTNSPYKSNGVLKARPADPIKDVEDIAKVQKYFLKRKEYRNYLIFTLGISFALRAGDLLSLKVKDVYNEDGTVKKEFTIYEDKTNKRNTIVINEQCREILDKYFYMISDHSDDGPLFESATKGKHGEARSINISALNKILSRAARDCNLPGHISSHSMRKTFVYHTIKAHDSDQRILLLLQKMLNHSDARTTLRYCGIEAEEIAALREEMGNLITPEYLADTEKGKKK